MADQLKSVLLYGDSFFWGVNPTTGKRHNTADRIGKQLQTMLGPDYEVVEEGHRGRTMFGENGWFPERDGLVQFGPILASHLPLHTVVFMLGTNDLNTKTLHEPRAIASALEEYRSKMEDWCKFMGYELPKVIVIAPPAIDEPQLDKFREIFAGSAANIDILSEELRAKCSATGYMFVDANKVVQTIGADGIHIGPAENLKIATELKQQMQSDTIE